MTAFKRATAALLAAAALAAAAVTATGPAQAADTSYYKTTWSSTIYAVDANGTPTALTYQQWVAAGSPTPTTARDVYSKFSWDPSIYRRTFFGAFPEFELHSETAAEWVATGRPTPVEANPQDASVLKWGTSDELFANTPDGVTHKLTGTQWSELGHIAPSVQGEAGFEKLTWASPIARMKDLNAGRGAPISYAAWAAQDFPTPKAVPRFPGDRFYRHVGSSTIFYAGPTMNRAVTYAEWTAAGRPTLPVK